jgi:sterol 24-C-methyltransferase
VRDLSENVLLILRMFYLLAFILYFIFVLFRLKSYFPNIVSGYEGYVYRNVARYIAVLARKPLASSEIGPGEEKKTR